MDKVKLPKEVAEAIETIRNAGMAEHALYDRSWLGGRVDDTHEIRSSKDTILKYIVFDGDRFDPDNQLIRYFKALVNGFEVEMTPEEKVREYVEKLKMKHYQATGSMNNAESTPGHELRGCLKMLDLLDIKISGVNAE